MGVDRISTSGFQTYSLSLNSISSASKLFGADRGIGDRVDWRWRDRKREIADRRYVSEIPD